MTPLHRDTPEPGRDRDERERLERLARHFWVLGLGPDDPPRPRPAPCLDCGHPTEGRAADGPLCEPCYSHRILVARTHAQVAAIFGPDDIEIGPGPEAEGLA